MARRGKSQARRSSKGSLPGWAWLITGAALALAVVLVAPKYFNSYFNSGQRADGFFRPRPNPEARPSISALDEADPPRPRPATQRPLPAPVTEPDYDFYTLLPDQETAISDSEIAARARAESEAKSAATPARNERDAHEQPERERPRPQSPRESSQDRTAAASRPAATATAPTSAPASPHPDAAAPAAAPARQATANTQTASRYLLQVGTFNNPAEAESLKAQIALLGLQARIEAGTADGKPVHRVRLGPYTSAIQLDEIKQRLDNGGLPALAVRIE